MPWTIGSQSFYDSVIEAIAERYEISLDVPWRELEREQQDKFLDGTDGDKIFVTYRNRMGRRRQYTMAFEGLVNNLQRRYRETDSSHQRDRIEEYMSFRPCPECGGARLKPEILAVTIGDLSIHAFTQMSVTRSLAFLDELALTKTEELIGRRIVKEIRERLTFLDNVGLGYLQLDRAATYWSRYEHNVLLSPLRPSSRSHSPWARTPPSSASLTRSFSGRFPTAIPTVCSSCR